jgi:hypothetical protein
MPAGHQRLDKKPVPVRQRFTSFPQAALVQAADERCAHAGQLMTFWDKGINRKFLAVFTRLSMIWRPCRILDGNPGRAIILGLQGIHDHWTVIETGANRASSSTIRRYSASAVDLMTSSFSVTEKRKNRASAQTYSSPIAPVWMERCASRRFGSTGVLAVSPGRTG